jgi:uroporphyrinogen III methyltransferase/synthase
MSATPTDRFVVVGFRRAEAPAASAALAPIGLADWPARLAAAGLGGLAMVTCERAEVIALTAETDAELRRRVAHALAAEASASPAIATALAVRSGRDAVRHLFRVASGLDSRLVGEGEIAAQLATAAATARSARALDRRLDRQLDRLTRWALETGRRVRAGLDATGARRSWVEAAVAAVREHGGERIALVGTGAFAEALARSLAAAGSRRPVFYGTHAARTAEVAARAGGEARDREALAAEWQQFDAVVFATRARRRIPLTPSPSPVDALTPGPSPASGRGESDDQSSPPAVGADQRVPPWSQAPATLLLDLGEPPLINPAWGTCPGVVRLDLAALEARYGLPPSTERRAAAEALVEAEVERFEARFLATVEPRWLLAAHGSGDGSATNEALRALGDQIARIAGRPVDVAFRRGTPSWEDVGGDPRPRIVVPVLAAAGYFAERVLPAALRGDRPARRPAATREVVVTREGLTEPVGTHPWLLAGQVDRVRLALSRSDWHLAAILVAGHGTSRHTGSGGSSEHLAGLLRDTFPAVPVAFGFLDQEPLLEQAAAELIRFRSGIETVVLVRHLLGGAHAEDDVPRRVAAALPAGTRLESLPGLLEEPALLPALLNRFGFAIGPPLRIGSRRSPLALVQAELVRAALGSHGIPARVVPLDTVGDREQDRPIEAFATQGPFTDELEGALRRGEVDIAVHSVKDLPLDEPGDLMLAALLERGPVADVMIGRRLGELPAGARVGTCSARRTQQLRRLRPDLVYAPIRGAIGARLAQLDAGRYDALVLAEAALVRLGLADRIAERLSTEQVVPEAGQGAIGLQIRAADTSLARRLAPVDHGPTRRAACAERDAARRGLLETASPGFPPAASPGFPPTASPGFPPASMGSVHLVGAGPGAADLLTLRGLDRLRAADVVVHDRLLTPELLDLAPARAERIDVGKEAGRVTLPQRAIERLLIDRARGGQVVVRLKGGDPFVFGRGAEELDACRAAGVPCEVVPGLSSAFAGPAGVGVPVTERGVARSVAVISAHGGDDTPPLGAAAHGAETVVVLMGLERLGSVAAELMAAGRPASTPAALVSHASWPTEAVRRTTLGQLEAAGRGLDSPALVVVGPTAARARPHASRGPLDGRTIALTRPEGAARRTAALLAARGARVVAGPLIEIELHAEAVLGAAVTERLPLARYPWLVFTSKHGVLGFWRGLRAAGRDARAFAGARVAVVGPATAAALEELGVVPDLVARPHRAEALVEALARELLPGHRVLFPAGSRARRETVDGLAAHGIAVEEIQVYETHSRAPAPAFRAALDRGVDAVVFTSPSAVASYVEHDLPRGGAGLVLCLGPTTADEALRLGFAEPRVAAEHSETGLIDTLTAALAERDAEESAA